ncbi:chondroitin proteoglycan 2 [Drosophila montana]|uniref:chondroitin proteoglycan 2 n=1 Tax=Drosophila montana TaxID=40370 RepID=UPI00313BAA11
MCKVKGGIAFIGCLLLFGAQRTVAQWSDICGDEADGTRLPLALDCGRFVVCQEREVAEIRRCPRGLHFNAQLGECDFQWRAECLGLSLFGKAASDEECVCTCCAEECPDGDLDQPTTHCPPEAEKTTPRDEGETDSVTDNVTDNTETLPSEGTTSAGTTQESPTSAGTTSKSTTRESTFDTDPTEAPGSSSTPPTGGEVPAYCSDKRTDCVNEPDGALLQLYGVCTKYIQCSHGCYMERTCPSGLYFDPSQNACNNPWNVDCTPADTDDADGELVGPSGTSCSDQGVCAGQRDGKMFANPDTNGYFVCQCQCPVAMPCDANTKFNETAQVCDWDRTSGTIGGSNSVICPDGLVYNATSDQCDYPDGYVPEVVCENNSTICQGQPEGTLFPIEGICNKFYKCNYNCAVEKICPNNLLYDSEAELCDYPQNVDCPWEHTPPSGPNAGPSGISCESNGRCLGQREGTLFPSLTSCSGYVVCQCECEVPMECSQGLYWDQTLYTCNYADKVDCSL